MTVLIVPLGSEGSEAGQYADELRKATRVVEALTPVEPAQDAADTADVIHIVASEGGAVTADSIAPFRARCRALVLTLLPSGSCHATANPIIMRTLHTVVFLTEACRQSALRDGMDRVGANVVPCAVPIPAGSWPPKSPDGPLEVVVMWPNPADKSALSEAAVAVAELPRGSRLTVVHDDDGASERAILQTAKQMGVAERVRAARCDNELDIHARVAQANAVIAPEPISAGRWNGLTALAYGRPLLAADRSIFRDLMLRAGCVRLVRLDQPGHLAACLRALFGNELGLRELSERGAAYGETHNWHAVAERMAEIYMSALSAASSRQVP